MLNGKKECCVSLHEVHSMLSPNVLWASEERLLCTYQRNEGRKREEERKLTFLSTSSVYYAFPSTWESIRFSSINTLVGCDFFFLITILLVSRLMLSEMTCIQHIWWGLGFDSSPDSRAQAFLSFPERITQGLSEGFQQSLSFPFHCLYILLLTVRLIVPFIIMKAHWTPNFVWCLARHLIFFFKANLRIMWHHHWPAIVTKVWAMSYECVWLTANPENNPKTHVLLFSHGLSIQKEKKNVNATIVELNSTSNSHQLSSFSKGQPTVMNMFCFNLGNRTLNIFSIGLEYHHCDSVVSVLFCKWGLVINYVWLLEDFANGYTYCLSSKISPRPKREKVFL